MSSCALFTAWFSKPSAKAEPMMYVIMIFCMVCLWLELKLVQGIASANNGRYNAGNRADC
jgi:hypothetical protein